MMDANIFQIVAVLALLGFMWTLHREVSNLHKDVRKDMAGLRQEFGKDIGDVRKDMADMRQEFGRDTADLRERMARMEGLLAGFVGRPQESQP
ncbi:MAG: hypothetical protein OXC38_09790 [Gammaproteobacteria bacterium]|nr:hypothetical protein [Gammaproteobacteria bacterium]